MQDHQPFFHKPLREGKLIYEFDSVEFSIPELDADQLQLRKAQLWYNRFNRASALMEAADNDRGGIPVKQEGRWGFI